MDRSPSSLIFDFLTEVVEAVTDEEDLLHANGCEILDSKSQKMTADRGMVVSNSEFTLEPGRLSELDIYDAVVIIAFWSKISGKEATQRMIPRDEVHTMARAVAAVMYGDTSLGGRVCDHHLLRATDGSRSVTSTEYAVINLPVILNPSGAAVSFNVGEAKP